jgi:hypothetical protein
MRNGSPQILKAITSERKFLKPEQGSFWGEYNLRCDSSKAIIP